MVKENILRVRERIALACAKAKRDPDSVTIVAVSKGRSVEEIKKAVACGITDVGENRLQEALSKFNALRFSFNALHFHMVGHLQTNKVKDTVKLFDLIHSVDSLHLAEEIDKQAAKINKAQDILIEVKTSPEESKFGFLPEEVPEIIKKISELKNVRVKGLMTIAPLVDNPEKSCPYFRMLKELQDKINRLQLTTYSLQLLSMGMTDDFEVAIEEGSNMVRLGRAIFG